MAKKVKFDFKPSDYIQGIRFKSARDKNRALADVSDFVLTKVLEDVGGSKSPVTGTKFKRLDREYASKKRKEVGHSRPNLEFDGDMLDSLRIVRRSSTGLRLEVSSSEQNAKADGHNNHSGKSKLPARKFIPNSKAGEDFRPGIQKGIKAILRKATKED